MERRIVLGARRIELALRHPQPALRSPAPWARRRCGKSSPCPAGSKAHSVAKMSMSSVLDETKSFTFAGPAISVSRAKRRRSEGDAFGSAPDRLRWRAPPPARRPSVLPAGVEMELRPLRFWQRPGRRRGLPLHRVAGPADRQLDLRLLLPAVVDVLRGSGRRSASASRRSAAGNRCGYKSRSGSSAISRARRRRCSRRSCRADGARARPNSPPRGSACRFLLRSGVRSW